MTNSVPISNLISNNHMITIRIYTYWPDSFLLAYALETTFVKRFLWNFVKMFVLTIYRPSSNMGYVGLTSRSPGQIFLLTLYRPQCLGQIRIWVMKGKQTRSNPRQLLCILVKLRPSNLDHLYNLHVVCGIELWHFITLNLTFWPTFTF